VSIGVHTNKSALTALQTLNRTTRNLEESQGRLNTGYKVATAKDNAAVYAVAQGQRADTSALSSVKTSMDRATSILDVALSAGESISDLLNQMKAKIVSAMDPSIDADARAAYDNDFKALLKQVGTIIANATFDGANLLDSGASISFLANSEATSRITVTGKNLSIGSASNTTLTLSLGANLLTLTAASGALNQLQASIPKVNAALGQLGSHAKEIEAHNIFVSKLMDVLEAGIGNLVDADLAKESARLQGLQVQQQLGTQALSIANQAPQVVLNLFRGG